MPAPGYGAIISYWSFFVTTSDGGRPRSPGVERVQLESGRLTPARRAEAIELRERLAEYVERRLSLARKREGLPVREQCRGPVEGASNSLVKLEGLLEGA